MVLAAVAPALSAPTVRAVLAQSGGTLVIGLDQEPPTLDPHASPSAVTYQIIASVTENLLYQGPDGKLVPWLAESWTTAARRAQRDLQAAPRREVPRRHAVQRRRGQVQLRPDRRPEVQGRRRPRAALAGYAGSKVLDEFTVQVTFETPYAPFLTYAAAGHAQPRLPQGGARDGRPGPHPAGRHRAFMIKEYVAKDHTTMVRNPAYTRKAPWSDRTRPRPARGGRLEVHPGGGHPRDHAGERRDAGHLSSARPVAAPPRAEHRGVRVEKPPWPGVPRIWLLNIDQAARWTTCKVRRAINHAVDKDAFLATVYEGTGLKAFAPLTAVMLDDPALRQAYPVRPGQGQGPARRSGLAAGGRRHPDEGRAAAGDRPERHRVRRRRRSHRAAHPVLAARRRDRRQDQGPGSPALVRGQLPLRDPRAGDVPALHRSRRPLRAVPLLAGRRQLQLVVREEHQARRSCSTRAGASPIPAKRRAIYLAIEKLALEEALTVPLVDELAVWAFRLRRAGRQVQLQRLSGPERRHDPPLAPRVRALRRADVGRRGGSSPWSPSCSG